MATLYNLARMTTATTGTGTITLGSAVTGFLSFVSAGALDGQTITYGIQDGSNSEIGRGVYTASGTTLTRTVLKSTNSGSAISLSGTAQVFITPSAEDFRELLAANRTYYVRTDGNDTNSGLVNTAGGAFLTIQKAIDVVATVDSAIYDVTIQVAAGTYSTPTGVIGKSMAGTGSIILIGDETTPSNVVVTTSGAMTSENAVVLCKALSTTYKLKGFKLTSTGSGTVYGLFVSSGSYVEFQKLDFGSGTSLQIRCDDSATLKATGIYSITGGASGNHIFSGNGTVRVQGYTVTVTGTPTFGTFATVNMGGTLFTGSTTWSGAATGTRYDASTNGVINTGGAGASHYPGSVAGATATGGQYT